MTVYQTLKNCWKPFVNNYQLNTTFHVITLNTPNYDNIGCYGANSLKAYCDKHGYAFTMYREKLEPDLHINFTKNSIAIEVLRTSKANYIVVVDSDIEIVNPDITLESLFDKNTNGIFYAPQDYFYNDKEWKNIINSGFIIWKNCDRSIEINKLWLNQARTNCKELVREKYFIPQQTTFTNCVLSHLKPGELQFLDHKKVGMTYSSFIRQSKTPKQGWEKMGKPNLLNCELR